MSLQQMLRSRGFVVCLHLVLWILLYLGLAGLRGGPPKFGQTASGSLPAQSALPVRKLGPLFGPDLVRQSMGNPTNCPNPFFTRYFVPPVPPTAPPPTTRKLDLTYLGFFQTADGPKHAVLNLAGGLTVVRVGTLVATNVYLAEANLNSIVLTNTSAQTNTLTLNTKKEIEVPIR